MRPSFATSSHRKILGCNLPSTSSAASSNGVVCRFLDRRASGSEARSSSSVSSSSASGSSAPSSSSPSPSTAATPDASSASLVPTRKARAAGARSAAGDASNKSTARRRGQAAKATAHKAASIGSRGTEARRNPRRCATGPAGRRGSERSQEPALSMMPTNKTAEPTDRACAPTSTSGRTNCTAQAAAAVAAKEESRRPPTDRNAFGAHSWPS
mmetsp:Transcript_28695/g.95269  ORF Transcript_28695/g.95269 Transcript_28695/m.95269 type:complete len:213 (+) Transcript_28695:827-1465(+)